MLTTSVGPQRGVEKSKFNIADSLRMVCPNNKCIFFKTRYIAVLAFVSCMPCRAEQSM